MRELQTSPWKFGLAHESLELEYDVGRKWFFNPITTMFSAGPREEDFNSSAKIPFTDQTIELWRIGYEVTAWHLQHGFNEGEDIWA